jgi:hypothetical protein
VENLEGQGFFYRTKTQPAKADRHIVDRRATFSSCDEISGMSLHRMVFGVDIDIFFKLGFHSSIPLGYYCREHNLRLRRAAHDKAAHRE